MADRPRAERTIDAATVHSLLVAQAPAFADLPLIHADEGWDCSVWRLGDEYAVRLPRRAVADELVVNEQRWVPSLAALLARSGVAAPTPIVAGRACAEFPAPWSLVPWFSGTSGLSAPRASRSAWAIPLARALSSLHVAADWEAPRNPHRGAPLRMRAGAIGARIAAGTERVAPDAFHALCAAWHAGLDTPPWSGTAVWLHGDLHPGNLVARGSELVALIDFGDVSSGDPCYDLAVAWLAFDAAGRADFVAANPSIDADTWVRARAWAAAISLILLQQSDDAPLHLALGAETADEIAAEIAAESR